MRRIVKACVLSTSYKQWHDGLEAANSNHPKYSSNHRFYLDVVMNLFHCQGGLCAYTEMLLCAGDKYEAGKWSNGCYSRTGATPKPQFWGQLEHFDSQLKKDKGWLWANLFMVHSDINNKVKGQRTVDTILKPDADDYDPFQKLEYSVSTHMFIPKTLLSEDLRKRIVTMILTLGLNHDTVRQHRIKCLSRLRKAIEFGLETWDTALPDEFPTAFAMVRAELKE